MGSQAEIQGVFNERVEHLNKYRRLMADALLGRHLIAQDAEILLLAKSFDQYEDISSVSLFYYLAEGGVLAIPDSDGSLIAIGALASPEASAITSNDKDFTYKKVEMQLPVSLGGSDSVAVETDSGTVPLAITYFSERYVVKPFFKKVLFSKTPKMSYLQKTFSGLLVENVESYPYLVQLTTTGLPRLLAFGDRLILGQNTYEVRLVQPINRLNDSVQKVMVSPVNFTDVPVQDTVDPPVDVPIFEDYKKLRTL